MVLQIPCHTHTGPVSVKRARHGDEPLTLHTHIMNLPLGGKGNGDPIRKTESEKNHGPFAAVPFPRSLLSISFAYDGD